MDIVTKGKKSAKRNKNLEKSANQTVNATIAFALSVKRNQCHKKETTKVLGLGGFLIKTFYTVIKKKGSFFY